MPFQKAHSILSVCWMETPPCSPRNTPVLKHRRCSVPSERRWTKPGSKHPAVGPGHGSPHTKARVVQQAALPSPVHLLRNGKALHTRRFLHSGSSSHWARPHLQVCQRSEVEDGCARLAEHVAVVCGCLVLICLGDPGAKQLRLPDIWLIAAQTRRVGKSSVEPEFKQHEGAAEAARFQRSVLQRWKLLWATSHRAHIAQTERLSTWPLALLTSPTHQTCHPPAQPYLAEEERP